MPGEPVHTGPSPGPGFRRLGGSQNASLGVKGSPDAGPPWERAQPDTGGASVQESGGHQCGVPVVPTGRFLPDTRSRLGDLSLVSHHLNFQMNGPRV